MKRFLALALLFLTSCGGDAGREGTANDALNQGLRVYATNCVVCHKEDGTGMPGVYPPIVGSEWVQGDEGRLIRLLLDGMVGPVVVKGETYNNAMTPFHFLKDEEIAAVLTFVRSNFGNEAGPVTADQVAAVRAADRREELWTAPELERATGIP